MEGKLLAKVHPHNSRLMLLLLDNYDSFVYNLAQYFAELGFELIVKRNDEVSTSEIALLAPSHICVSPGPCTPREAGISKEVILRFGEQTPILCVCLGHQCIAEAYGGKIVRASRLGTMPHRYLLTCHRALKLAVTTR